MVRDPRRILPLAGALVAGSVILATLWLRGEEASGLPTSAASRSNALLVHRFTPERLLLGTDDGVFESTDGGRSWERSGLAGREVAALARVKGGTVWAGGPGFLAGSSDGGRSWTDVRPPGLPTLDIRALSGSRDVAGRLEAAVGGAGLYRSRDGGRTFVKLGPSSTAGSEALSLVETTDGVLFLSDRRHGLIANSQGNGIEWIEVLEQSPSALAPSFGEQRDGLLLAATSDGLLRTVDKGGTWRPVLSPPSGIGTVGFSQSRVELAYALARDGTTYRSTDFGLTWRPAR